MPFQSDTRCPFMRVQLNTSYIAELLEDLLEMDFVDDTGFDGYVELIEDEFSCFYCNNPTLNFNDWFLDNYNDYDIYDEMVEKCFEKRNNELKQIGWLPQTRLGECEGCAMICDECERLVITE